MKFEKKEKILMIDQFQSRETLGTLNAEKIVVIPQVSLEHCSALGARGHIIYMALSAFRHLEFSKHSTCSIHLVLNVKE
jgi:hypothetical protein